MSDKKCLGFIFRSYKNDHQPYHIHVLKYGKELGRFDIVNRRPMDAKLKIGGTLRKALEKLGYL